MQIGGWDRFKMALIRWIRWINERSIQSWSVWSYRRKGMVSQEKIETVSAIEFYQDPQLPEESFVARKIPASGLLRLEYTIPYYYLTGSLFKIYQKMPILPSVLNKAALCSLARVRRPYG